MTSPAPPRFDVPVIVGRADGSAPLGVSSNMSANGMLVETDERPEIGSRHNILLAWDVDTFQSTVEVVRHADNGIAVKYVDAPPEFVEAVHEMMRTSPELRGSVKL